MNPLKAELKDEYVVLKSKVFKGTDAERVFLCKGGFGCSPDTMGRAVMGEFIFDGSSSRVESYEIERFATSFEIEEARKLKEEAIKSNIGANI